jgi:hypothetical protein
MLKPLTFPAALLAALAIAAPASAQAPTTDTTQAPVCTGVGEDGSASCTQGDQAPDQTIGDGQTITDPADQVDGPTVPSDGDGQDQADTPKQGESHVLGETATSSSPSATPPPAPSPQPVAQPAVAAPQAKTLPFTGVDALPLVEMGVALLLMGWLLRRRLEA